ncbi:Hypothetical predicted protein, partial [Paramuricea clavata]
MLVAKTNQGIEKNISLKGMQRKCTLMMLLVGEIISKLKLELKVTRVREYSADRACIRNIKTDLIVRCGNPDGSAAILPVYVQQGETAVKPYKDSPKQYEYILQLIMK